MPWTFRFAGSWSFPLCHMQTEEEGVEFKATFRPTDLRCHEVYNRHKNVCYGKFVSVCVFVYDYACLYESGIYHHETNCLRIISSGRLSYLPHKLHCEENFYVFYIDLPSLKCLHFIHSKERHAATSL